MNKIIFCFLILYFMGQIQVLAHDKFNLNEDSLLQAIKYAKYRKFHKPFKEEGGWVQNKGTGFFRLAQNMISSQKFFARDTEVIDITTTSVYISNFYGEYGISEKLTAIAYIPFFTRVVLNELRFRPSNNTVPGDELNGMGDFLVGAKYGLVRNKPVVISASLLLGIPIGNPEGGETKLLQTGDGEFNQLIRIEAGYSVPKTNLYLTGGVGFNNRTKDFSDEFHYNFEVGYSFMKSKLIAIMKVYGVVSFFNGEAAIVSNGIFANNTEFLSYTPQLVYNINKNWGVDINAGFALTGRNILAAPNYSLGVFYKLTKE